MAYILDNSQKKTEIKTKIIYSNNEFEYIIFKTPEELRQFLEETEINYRVSNNVYNGNLGRKISSLDELKNGDFILIYKED